MTKNPRDIIFFHNHIFKIAVKILIFILAYRRRVGHDNEPVTLIFAVIRRVDMLERIGSVPGTLIKKALRRTDTSSFGGSISRMTVFFALAEKESACAP